MRKIFGIRLSDVIGNVLLPGGVYDAVRFTACISNDPASKTVRNGIMKFREVIDNEKNRPKRHDRNGSVE